jgi:hypothetical protein
LGWRPHSMTSMSGWIGGYPGTPPT